MTKNVLYCNHCKLKRHSSENCRHLHNFALLVKGLGMILLNVIGNQLMICHGGQKLHRIMMIRHHGGQKLYQIKMIRHYGTRTVHRIKFQQFIINLSIKVFNVQFPTNKSSSSKSDTNQAQKTNKKKQTSKQVNQVSQLFLEIKRTSDDSPMRFDVYQNIEHTD